MKRRIFLSYSRDDAEIAEEIRIALARDGHQVFFDKENLAPGGDYRGPIRDAILGSDLFLFLASPSSVKKGAYTLSELETARTVWSEPGHHVLTVKLHGTDPKSVPAYLRSSTWCEVEGDAAQEVLAAVGQVPMPRASVSALAWLSGLFFVSCWLTGLVSVTTYESVLGIPADRAFFGMLEVGVRSWFFQTVTAGLGLAVIGAVVWSAWRGLSGLAGSDRGGIESPSRVRAWLGRIRYGSSPRAIAVNSFLSAAILFGGVLVWQSDLFFAVMPGQDARPLAPVHSGAHFLYTVSFGVFGVLVLFGWYKLFPELYQRAKGDALVLLSSGMVIGLAFLSTMVAGLPWWTLRSVNDFPVGRIIVVRSDTLANGAFATDTSLFFALDTSDTDRWSLRIPSWGQTYDVRRPFLGTLTQPQDIQLQLWVEDPSAYADPEDQIVTLVDSTSQSGIDR